MCIRDRCPAARDLLHELTEVVGAVPDAFPPHCCDRLHRGLNDGQGPQTSNVSTGTCSRYRNRQPLRIMLQLAWETENDPDRVRNAPTRRRSAGRTRPAPPATTSESTSMKILSTTRSSQSVWRASWMNSRSTGTSWFKPCITSPMRSGPGGQKEPTDWIPS